MHISTVYWKSDERLLFRVTVRPEEDADAFARGVIEDRQARRPPVRHQSRRHQAGRDAGRQPQCGARRRIRPRRHQEFPAQGSQPHPHGARRIQRAKPVQGGSRHRARRTDGAPQRIRGRLVAGRRGRSGGAHHRIQRNDQAVPQGRRRQVEKVRQHARQGNEGASRNTNRSAPPTSPASTTCWRARRARTASGSIYTTSRKSSSASRSSRTPPTT